MMTASAISLATEKMVSNRAVHVTLVLFRNANAPKSKTLIIHLVLFPWRFAIKYNYKGNAYNAMVETLMHPKVTFSIILNNRFYLVNWHFWISIYWGKALSLLV